MEMFVRTQTTRMKEQPVPGPRLARWQGFLRSSAALGGAVRSSSGGEKRVRALQGLTVGLGEVEQRGFIL